MAPSPLGLDGATRRRLWDEVGEAIEDYHAGMARVPIAPDDDPGAVRASLAALSPGVPLAPEAAIRFVIEGLRTRQLHAAHPGYFGLFVPAPSAMGIVADAIAAGFNPQLASWSHAPFAVEAEQWVVRTLAERLGYPPEPLEGSVTTGGSEANLTALLAALYHAWPGAVAGGIRSLPHDPCLYVSAEAHDSWRKAARVAGLGEQAVRRVPCDREFRLDPAALAALLAGDRRRGLAPFLVVGTVGSTASGAIDPIRELHRIAAAEGLWLHADAAWGGAAALSGHHREAMAGLADADSLTLDAHKWLSAPMGAGVYLSRRSGALRAVFATRPGYLPSSAAGAAVTEPYQESLQWSRRFSGLKILLTLITAGWAGVAAAIDANVELGRRLAAGLRLRDWLVVNRTPLPVVCFRETNPVADPAAHHQAIVDAVNRRGRSWVSLALLGGSEPAIRACVGNYRTTDREIDNLLEDLEWARHGR